MWSQRPVLSLSEPFPYSAEEESGCGGEKPGAQQTLASVLVHSECHMPTPCLGSTLFTELCLCPPGSQAPSALTYSPLGLVLDGLEDCDPYFHDGR